MQFLEEIKREARPDSSNLKEIDATVEKINREIRMQGIRAVCTKGGSVAKGTFLKGDFDVDLFARFDYSYRDRNISDLLEKVLVKVFHAVERIHGSRDYFQAKDSFSYEIVPVLDITDPKMALNVTDMSPLHVDWLKKHIKKGQEDEIRLAKVFCKANGLYGAESYINGFSGHVIDILIVQYGSFTGLLEAASAWKPKVVIDVMRHYKDKAEAIDSISYSKTYGPLIVVDPVLPVRNAAAALSLEKFRLFIKAAREFLEKPGREFFVKKGFDIRSLTGLSVVYRLRPKEGKADVMGSRILKCYEYLVHAFSEHGFAIKKSGWEWDRKSTAVIWFSFSKKPLPMYYVKEGPPASLKAHYENFARTHKGVYVKDGRAYAREKREYRLPGELAEKLASSPYLSERASSVEIENFK